VIKTASKINLFFLELTIMLLILAVSMAVCIQVFFHAQTTADYSRDLSNATIKAQSAAASYKSFAGDLNKTATFLEGNYETNKAVAYYDKEWQSAGSDSRSYQLSITNEDNRVARIQVVRLADQLELYTIKVRAVDYE